MNRTLALALIPIFAASAFASSPRLFSEVEWGQELNATTKAVKVKKTAATGRRGSREQILFTEARRAGMDQKQALDVSRNAPAPDQAIACYPTALMDTRDKGIAFKLCRNSSNAFRTHLCYTEKMRTLIPAQTSAAVEACSAG